MALWKVLNGMWVPIRQYASDEVPSEVLTKYLYQIDYRTKLVLYYYIYSFNIYTVHTVRQFWMITCPVSHIFSHLDYLYHDNTICS